jgi:chalcone isomerase-like protein
MRRIAALSLGLLLAAPLLAGSLAGVTMDDSKTVAGQALVLNGLALRSKFGFKVYVAGLYLPEKETDAKKVLAEDEARHMVMQWVRNVEKAKVCEGFEEGLEANTPKASADVKKNFESLCGMLQDARTGDRFTYTYVPGTGVEVAVNDQVKGTLGAKPFADALFAVWIGPHPGPGEDFREALMGKKG